MKKSPLYNTDKSGWDAEDVLRHLCFFLRIGGFGGDFDIDVYLKKVEDEISRLQLASMKSVQKSDL